MASSVRFFCFFWAFNWFWLFCTPLQQSTPATYKNNNNSNTLQIGNAFRVIDFDTGRSIRAIPGERDPFMDNAIITRVLD